MNDPKNLHHCMSWVRGRSFGGRTVHGGDNHEITNNSKLQKIPLFCHNPQVWNDSWIYRNVQPPTRIQTCCKWRTGCWNILQQRSLLLRTKHEPSSVLEKSLAGNRKWTIIAHIKDIICCTRLSGSENGSRQEVSELFHVHRATHPLLKLIYTQCSHCW